MQGLMIFSYLIAPLYLLPMMWSIFYLSIQKIEDIYNRSDGNKAFKDKRHFRICIIASLIPIVNIVITYISMKTIIKSIFR